MIDQLAVFIWRSAALWNKMFEHEVTLIRNPVTQMRWLFSILFSVSALALSVAEALAKMGIDPQ